MALLAKLIPEVKLVELLLRIKRPSLIHRANLNEKACHKLQRSSPISLLHTEIVSCNRCQGSRKLLEISKGIHPTTASWARPPLTARYTCPMTRRTIYRDSIIGTSNQTCLSRTHRQARRTRIINPSCQIFKTILILPVKIRIISSQREFQNHNRLNWAITWSRRITKNPTLRSAKTTLQATASKTSQRTKSKKSTPRASILSKPTKRTVPTPRRTDRPTPSSASAWTRTMASLSTTASATSATAPATSATSPTAKASSKTQAPSSHPTSAARNRNFSSRNLRSRAWDRAFRRNSQRRGRNRPKIRFRRNSRHRLPRRTSMCRLRSLSRRSSSLQMFHRHLAAPRLKIIIRGRCRAAVRGRSRRARARITRAVHRI